jgi:hypothetical protein
MRRHIVLPHPLRAPTRLASERQRVRSLIRRAGIAMLMNLEEHGYYMGRPML